MTEFTVTSEYSDSLSYWSVNMVTSNIFFAKKIPRQIPLIESIKWTRKEKSNSIQKLIVYMQTKIAGPYELQLKQATEKSISGTSKDANS